VPIPPGAVPEDARPIFHRHSPERGHIRQVNRPEFSLLDLCLSPENVGQPAVYFSPIGIPDDATGSARLAPPRLGQTRMSTHTPERQLRRKTQKPEER
jgi:hypothetical protein